MLFDMNILHLSDTHGAHRSLVSLPEADVIVHSGDIAMNFNNQVDIWQKREREMRPHIQ